METLITWWLMATGFTGGLTLVFVVRRVHAWWVKPLALAVHFSPKGGCTEAVVRELAHARQEILVQAYSFTSKAIAQALADARHRGVRVEILLDRSNEQEMHTELGDLLGQGLKPLIDAHHAIAHNKVILIDQHTLITGSFNFTHAAETDNAENLVVIKGQPELVGIYCKNFALHKAHSQPPAKVVPAAPRKAG